MDLERSSFRTVIVTKSKKLPIELQYDLNKYLVIYDPIGQVLINRIMVNDVNPDLNEILNELQYNSTPDDPFFSPESKIRYNLLGIFIQNVTGVTNPYAMQNTSRFNLTGIKLSFHAAEIQIFNGEIMYSFIVTLVFQDRHTSVIKF